jgi:SAM-dependent methyltransferase
VGKDLCPWQLGYLQLLPLRRIIQNPEKILEGYVSEGLTVLDIGCAMGYFSIPMAKMVGECGRVICVDIQPKMVEILVERARNYGLERRILPRLSYSNSLGFEDIKNEIDFCLAFAVIHELPNQNLFFERLKGAMKADGKLLIAESFGHVSEEDFEKSLFLAQNAGFKIIERLKITRSRAALLISTL